MYQLVFDKRNFRNNLQPSKCLVRFRPCRRTLRSVWSLVLSSKSLNDTVLVYFGDFVLEFYEVIVSVSLVQDTDILGLYATPFAFLQTTQRWITLWWVCTSYSIFQWDPQRWSHLKVLHILTHLFQHEKNHPASWAEASLHQRPTKAHRTNI